MQPGQLLDAIFAALLQRPPAGLDADDVTAFFNRHRDQLLAVLRKALPAGRIEPAFTRLREEHRLARIVLEAARHPDPAGAAELADLIDGIHDHVHYEDSVLFPFLRSRVPGLVPALDHAREEHAHLAEALVALSSALRFGHRYEGPAIDDTLHHLDEEERDLVAPALAAGIARTPAGNPGQLSLFAADIARLADPTAGAEPTRHGGLRGARLALANVKQGQRVVTEQGDHGVVTEVIRTVMTALFGGVREEEVHHSVTLRLDSGRQAVARGDLFAEVSPPASVVPDVRVGDEWLGPTEVWSRAYSRYREHSAAREREQAARKPEKRAEWRQQAERRWREFREAMRALEDWRASWPGEPLEGPPAHLVRRLSLEALDARSEAERRELELLKRLPSDWERRFNLGDAVRVRVWQGSGFGEDPGWTVGSVSGHLAVLRRGEETWTAPLWLLIPDEPAPVEERFDEPRYLMDLAQEMLAPQGSGRPYPERAAVARAVKSFLTEQGLAVSTRVARGAGVTSIDLSPGRGRWSPEEVRRIRALLPGLRQFNDQQAYFEPWERQGERFDPHADYPGKGAGIAVPAEHLPRFSALLAGAMKAAGQTLSELGERRLAAGATRQGAQAGTASGVAGQGAQAGAAAGRGAPTEEQRDAAAAGCRELDFVLPGHGRIRVVCGRQGTRDVWFNLYIGRERFGFNGGRWARKRSPPAAVLAAVRERGVTAFG